MNHDVETFDRLERFYDEVPRDAATVEDFGSLLLFVRTSPGWPFYARPHPGATTRPTTADIAAVRARQRELGVPESFEWVHENDPDLIATARSAGLAVLPAPLLVLDPAALADPGTLTDAQIRLARPDRPTFAVDIALQRAVAQVGFDAPGTAVGAAGPAARDAALRELAVDEIAEARRRVASGRLVTAIAGTPAEGALAAGVLQRVDDVGEIAGIATLPCARRRGLGAAVTAALARYALDTGVDLVFLSAGSEEIARVYQRVGFHRIGTACIAEPVADSGHPDSREPGRTHDGESVGQQS